MNSLRAHLDLIETTLSDSAFHVLAITETWLTPLVPTECLTIPNYNLIRNDRKIYDKDGTRFLQGGGVGCYVHDSISHKVLALSDNVDINSPEYLILEIKTASSPPMLFTVLYRRPHGHLFSEFILKSTHIRVNIRTS